MVDIRDEERVAGAVHEAADKFGGIDILINKPCYSAGAGEAELLHRRRSQRHCYRSAYRHMSGTMTLRCRPSRCVAAPDRRSLRARVAGACSRVLLPARFVENIHNENLYGSSRNTLAAGVLGPAPIPTLKLSLVDCEIWYPRPKLKVP
jgi:hypothetical protein